MDFRRRFEFGLAWRTLLLVGAIWLFTKSLEIPEIRAGRIVAAFIALAAVASLWTFIRRTNLTVSRFVDSVRFEDYSQRFSSPRGGGFDVLGETLDGALKTLQTRHHHQAAEARYLSAIVDDAPSALLTLDAGGKVELLNKEARLLFARHQLTSVADLGDSWSRACIRRCVAARRPQDYSDHPRRCAAEGGFRFRAGRSAGRAGDGDFPASGPDRVRRTRNGSPGGPRASS